MSVHLGLARLILLAAWVVFAALILAGHFLCVGPLRWPLTCGVSQ